MKIAVTNRHFGYERPIAVWKRVNVTVNGKPSTWTFNVNPKLTEFGKAFHQVKGTWSEEKLEASRGQY